VMSTTGSLLTCWGDDGGGQLLAPTAAVSSFGLTNTGACANDLVNGTVMCWGSDSGGLVSGAPPGAFNVLDAGAGTVCALRSFDSTPACWGSDVRNIDNPPPYPMKQISLGTSHGCAVMADDTANCWGSTDDGRAQVPAAP